MYFLVNKITNKNNGKYYISAHKTNDKNDDYFGSGSAIKRALKKYGKDSFIKEILYEAMTEKEMFEKEKELLGDKWKDDFLCYNNMPGGSGGFKYINDFGLNKGDLNVMKRPEVAAKISYIVSYIRKSNPVKYNLISTQNLQKAIDQSKKNKGKTYEEIYGYEKSNEIKQIQSKKNKDRLSKAENREKLKNSLNSTYRIIKPDGEEFVTNRLWDFLKQKETKSASLWHSAINNGKVIKKGIFKGWKAYII